MVKQTIYLYINGACGNQFFQYAFARSLQEKTGADLVINYSLVRAMGDKLWAGSDNLLKDFSTVDYTYDLKGTSKDIIFRLIGKWRRVFRLGDFQKRTYRFMLRLAHWLPYLGVYYFDAAYYPFSATKAKTILIQGYFESPKYFFKIDDKIKDELLPKHPPLEQNRELLKKISDTESVCITIKRQDIENPDISDVYTYDVSYFYRGIEYIKSKVEHPVFFIFSDDVAWCRSNLKIDGEVYFETDGNPIWEKIRLMSSCKHFIIHNSTFSWWVQHLSKNPNKIVLAPTRWMQRDDQPIDIYEDNWLYITPDGIITDQHE